MISGKNMNNQRLKGVMLNAYPDSVGQKLEDMVDLLESEYFRDVFSLSIHSV